ncbi:hypothetical protein B0J17DRAFT_42789 [Rhizoctonia solani]|nr:hypothetical protein B0J17DRAFT_42789 [Rhizoctonia solani]
MTCAEPMKGFCACTTGHDERDETNPFCLCCQQSRIERPVHTKFEHSNIITTTAQPETPLTNAERLGQDPATFEASYGVLDTFGGVSVGTQSEDTEEQPVSSYSTPDTKSQDEATTHEEESLKGVVCVVYPELVLDRTVESNALPFVIQAYSTWIGRLALDLMKLKGIS